MISIVTIMKGNFSAISNVAVKLKWLKNSKCSLGWFVSYLLQDIWSILNHIYQRVKAL